jgi:hypothetical protein
MKKWSQAHFPLAGRLQIDADPDPDLPYHFDEDGDPSTDTSYNVDADPGADPDPTFQFDADPFGTLLTREF